MMKDRIHRGLKSYSRCRSKKLTMLCFTVLRWLNQYSVPLYLSFCQIPDPPLLQAGGVDWFQTVCQAGDASSLVVSNSSESSVSELFRGIWMWNAAFPPQIVCKKTRYFRGQQSLSLSALASSHCSLYKSAIFLLLNAL